MAKVKKVIAGVKGRQEIDNLVIWKRAIENLEVVAHSTDCGKALMMIVDDKGAI